jgi:hypothetical protein
VTHSVYDAFVARSPERSVFATSWWLDAVTGGAWRLHSVQEQGEIVAAWPTVPRETRLGTVHAGARLTPFLGPLFAPDDDPARRRSLQVRCLCLRVEALEPFAHLEARCNPAFDYWAPLSWRGFSQTTLYTWRLADLGDLDAVLAGIKGNVRGDIRKAERQGVEVGEGTLAEFLAVQGKTAEQKGFGGGSGNPVLERIDAAAGPRGARTILVAGGADGLVHAGAYLVHDDRFTYYLAGGSDPALRTSGAGSLVVWAAIQAAAERGLGFDFEGSMIAGVEKFFRAFGGEPAPYSVVRATPSRALRALRPVKSAARRLTRRR